jgi:cytochrome c peroxidase
MDERSEPLPVWQKMWMADSPAVNSTENSTARILIMNTKLLIMGAAILLASSTSSLPAAEPAELRQKALEVVAPIPERMPGAENDTPAQIALGKRLFFEKRLSQNGTQSCNSCHAVDKGRGGVDNQPTSPGAFGKRGGRNSPTVLNAGFHTAQFWDGRAEDLAAQAKGPILNPIEMAMPDENEVLARLNADKRYVREFTKAFPGDTKPVTYDNLAKAIAAFERTLTTRDRFDDFLKGKDIALTELELKGLNEFLTVGCATCHYGPLVGGNGFRKIGILEPYSNTADKGRIEVTKDEADEYVFKVPSLRNIALTGPYFHDGKHGSLADAVREMGRLQLGQTLNDEQVKAIVAFLNAMSDKGRKAPKTVAAAGTGQP